MRVEVIKRALAEEERMRERAAPHQAAKLALRPCGSTAFRSRKFA